MRERIRSSESEVATVKEGEEGDLTEQTTTMRVGGGERRAAAGRWYQLEEEIGLESRRREVRFIVNKGKLIWRKGKPEPAKQKYRER